jgi:UTP--glucose-1-phosphate uridylyltransferase
VTGRGKGAIEDHFDHSYELEDSLRERGKEKELKLLDDMLMRPGQVAYLRQQEPMGLGHAVWCARTLVDDDEPVAVLLADDLILAEESCLAQMVEAYHETGGNILAVMDVPKEQTKAYGVVSPGETSADGRLVEVKGLVEKPEPDKAPSTLAVIGRYILQPDVFKHLAKGQKGEGGEIQLTDAMADMIGEHPFHGLRFDGQRFDCGSKIGFLEANIAFGLEREDMAGDLREILKNYR